MIAGPRNGQTGNRPDKKGVHQGEMDYPRGPALLFVKTIRLANSFSIYGLLFFHFTLPKKIMLDVGLYFMKRFRDVFCVFMVTS